MKTKITQDMVPDTAALLASDTARRRDFLKVGAGIALGAGYVAAADPVMAQAIKTDFNGIKGEEVSYKSLGVDVPAYVSKPEKPAKNGFPVVIVVSEIFGVHEYIADVTRRFAKQGYMAIAPEFFVRAGDPNLLGTVAEIQKEIVGKTPDEQVMADIRAAIAWAGKNGGDTRRVGITGFCWGGRITWLAAAQVAEIKAGVAWYGRLVGDKTPNNPLHPVDLAAQIKAPVLGLYGSADTGIPLDTVDAMKKALLAVPQNRAAQQSLFEIYPDAPHAFHADYRNTYREGPAKDGWQKCLDWFKKQGVV